MNPTREDCLRNYEACVVQRASLVEQAQVLESSALWWRDLADRCEAAVVVMEYEPA